MNFLKPVAGRNSTNRQQLMPAGAGPSRVEVLHPPASGQAKGPVLHPVCMWAPGAGHGHCNPWVFRVAAGSADFGAQLAVPSRCEPVSAINRKLIVLPQSGWKGRGADFRNTLHSVVANTESTVHTKIEACVLNES